jgi:hypothetical protein
MIPGPELKNWLRQPQEQRHAREAAERFALAWKHGPSAQHFRRALGAARGAEEVSKAIASLFENDDALRSYVEGLSQQAGEQLLFDPPFASHHSDIHTGMVFFEDGNVTITAGVTNVAQLAAKKNGARGPLSIGFTGIVSVLKFVKAGGVRLSFWEAPRITGSFRAAEAGRCVRTGERRVNDGEVLIVDGRFQSYIIEHAETDILLLQALVKHDQAPLSVEYDAHTLEFVGTNATDDGASRVQMIATLLRKMECDEAFPVLAEFLDDPNFFVRWHVMRELLGIDAGAALPHLRRLAESDPHPDVRRAAQAVLQRVLVQHPGLARSAPCHA